MNKSTVWVAVSAAALGAAGAVVILSLSGGVAGGPGGPPGSAPGGPGGWGGGPQPPAVVETAPLVRGTYTPHAEFVGSLRANAQAELYAKASGQIEAIFADTGERVRAGQLLARIDDDSEIQQLAQAKAALRIAEATHAQRKANLEIAETTAQRIRNLFGQNLLPQQDLDDAEAQVQGASAQVDVAAAQVTQADAAVDAAEVSLARTRVEAPFKGRIGKRYLDVGARASTNDPVFSVVDLSVIKTTVPLTERDAIRVAPGQPAAVRTDVLSDRVFEGRVARMASVFDPQTHTTEAEVEIDNRDGLLKPGMFATVTIDFQQLEEALLVPATALVEDGHDTWIYLAERAIGDAAPGDPAGDAAGDPVANLGTAGARPAADTRVDDPPAWRARRVPVETLGGGLARGDTRVAIAPVGTSLEPGTKVITLGQEDLRDGAEIRLAAASNSHQGGAGPAVAPPAGEP